MSSNNEVTEEQLARTLTNFRPEAHKLVEVGIAVVAMANRAKGYADRREEFPADFSPATIVRDAIIKEFGLEVATPTLCSRFYDFILEHLAAESQINSCMIWTFAHRLYHLIEDEKNDPLVAALVDLLK